VLLLAGLVVIGALALALARPGPDRPRWNPVAGYAAWAISGLLLTVAVLALPSIGLFLLPFAAAAAVYSARRFPGAPVVGLIAGGGLALVAIGIVNLGNHSCPRQPVSIPPGRLTSTSCGGPSAWPWLMAGTILLVIGLALAAVLWSRTRSPSRSA
jgi:hypothetical protein